MKHLLTGIASIILLMAAIGSLAAQNKNSVEGDLEALRDLYESTNGGSWSNNSGWLNGKPANDWFGVDVNSEGRVIKLDLYSNNLSGELPESIGNLSKLKFFSVKDNPIYSAIPQSIANWVDMEILLLSSNQGRKVRYNIPDLKSFNLHPGKTPNASIAKYYGRIPDVFDRMPNLRMLEIAWSTDLDPQSYPSSLYSHEKLEVLTLTGNNLQGELLNSFDLPNLKIFLFGNNSWTGSLPSSLGNSTLLRKFQPGNSDAYAPKLNSYLSGFLPSSFANLVNMKYFFITNHNIGGEIPGFMIENWSTDPRDGLREINISGNNFTGEIPKEFGNFNITVFSLRDNNFTGSIHPDIVSGMQNVIIFNIKLNNLSGDLPNGQMVNGEWRGWRTKKRLRTLTFDSNNFTGPLPDMPEYVGDMSMATFHRNNFEGPIPDTWRELFTPELRDENPKRTFNNLQLRGNQLEGVIPEWFNLANGPAGDVGGNKWTHKDILENRVNVGFQSSSLNENKSKPFGEKKEQIIPLGATFTFDYSHRVHMSDEVQWTKNGRPISGATSSVLTIENVNSSDEALYRIELTNNGVPPHGSSTGFSTVVSEPIELKIGEPDSPPPSAPSLSSPASESKGLSVTPTLKWNSVSDASGYQLQVAADTQFSNLHLEENSISSTQQEVSGLDFSSTYYWRLRAVNSEGESEWSQSWSFTTEEDDTDNSTGENLFPSAPVQSYPIDNAAEVSLTPDFKWSAVDGADYYILHVSRLDPTGMSIDVFVEGTEFTTPEILGDGTKHDWRVRAVKDGELGEWSEIHRFTTRNEGLPDVAELVAPIHFAEEVDPEIEFVWEDTGADYYEIRMFDKRSGEIILTDQSNNSSYTPEEALPDTTEFVWQVKNLSGGISGAWGPRWEFSTGIYKYVVEAPSLIAPDLGSEYDNLTPIFEWSEVRADHYVIAVFKEKQSNAKSITGQESESYVIFDQTEENLYMPDTRLDPDTRYYWRVRAVKDGKEGEWSEMWKFTTPGGQNVSNEPREQPLHTTLAQNFPNPFNPTTQIEFTIDGMKSVTLAVYDMAGREVAILVDEVLGAGSHASSFDASNLSSGVYIYRLVVGNNSRTKKMTLIK